MKRQVAPWLLGLGVALAGCGKTGKNPHADTPAGSGGGGGIAGSASTAGANGDFAGAPPLDCDGDSPRPGPSPLTRLDRIEVNSSVRALLLPGASVAEGLFLSENVYDYAATEPPSYDTVKALHALAGAVAVELTEGPSAQGWLAECDVGANGEEACRDLLLGPLLERAYRRPLTAEDREELAEVFASGRKLGGDFQSGLRAVIEVALQGPDFLYLLELGNGQRAGDAVELTGFESAARLAYFLTASPPDAELMEAAKQGSFSAEELAAQAARLLELPSSRRALSGFYARRFSAHPPKENPELGLTTDLARDAVEASRRFVEDVVFDGSGTFRALLTEPSVWTNGPLAAYYGYPATGSDWQKVSLEATRYGGFFTQPAFLSSVSSGTYASEIRRGTRLLRQVLCYDLPPPPEEVELSPLEPPPANATARQRVEHETRAASCAECHQYINPVGFAFGHYDAVGKWRAQDQGAPVDASGVLDRTDAAGPFTDALGLMQNIAGSQDAQGCFVQLWLERAQRRAPAPADECNEVELTSAFVESGGKIVPLLVDISRSDNLRYRLQSELSNGTE